MKRIQQWSPGIRALPGGGLRGAVEYMGGMWNSGLLRFLDDPNVPIENMAPSGASVASSLVARAIMALARSAAPKSHVGRPEWGAKRIRRLRRATLIVQASKVTRAIERRGAQPARPSDLPVKKSGSGQIRYGAPRLTRRRRFCCRRRARGRRGGSARHEPTRPFRGRGLCARGLRLRRGGRRARRLAL